jgi:hypothetical protein
MKHSNLWNEVYKGEKPDTTWHKTLVAVVVIVALSFLILNYGIISEEVVGLIK